MNKLRTFAVKNWTVFGQTFFKPPFKISDALINEARIVFVVQGNSILYSANHSTNLYAGDTLIMKTDNFVNNWLENDTDSLNHVIVFQLNSEFLHYLYRSQLPEWIKNDKKTPTNAIEKITGNELLTSFFDQLQVYLNSDLNFTEEIIQLKIKELIAILIQTDSSGSVKRIFENLFDKPKYNFQETIQKNLFEDLGVEDLAFLTGMSLSSFKRKFSSMYGTSPNKYITSKRLEKAQSLLSKTSLNISEIAYQCGYSDVSYFSKTFKKYYNIPPSDIRKFG